MIQQLDAKETLMKLAFSLEKKIAIINFPLTVVYEESDGYQVDAVNIPEVGVQAFAVCDGTIAVGTETVIHGCWTLSNGDPGYPDEYDFNEEGSVPLHQYQKAVDMMLQLAVVAASGIVDERVMEEEMYKKWQKEIEEEEI